MAIASNAPETRFLKSKKRIVITAQRIKHFPASAYANDAKNTAGGEIICLLTPRVPFGERLFGARLEPESHGAWPFWRLVVGRAGPILGLQSGLLPVSYSFHCIFTRGYALGAIFPPPFTGEVRPKGGEGQVLIDAFKHDIEPFVDTLVRYAKHKPTARFQIGVPPAIMGEFGVGRMGTAIHFDDETRQYASKIGDIRSNRMLSAKAKTTKRASAQTRPQKNFGVGHSLTKFLRVLS